ncbi:hypothetical protein T4E_6737 [Trichinella pseudospiralis]|uniref:Uncharacterized protein n=1 Tax=Trichinella pseudospiralis TaxID=6337 RepID=A0A0V0XZ33_TRIPS|nr:hypothetical protein T4E_6737 [Trichinella pseudospiralis]
MCIFLYNDERMQLCESVKWKSHYKEIRKIDDPLEVQKKKKNLTSVELIPEENFNIVRLLLIKKPFDPVQ